MQSECPQCKRRIGAKTSCRCGWVMPGGANDASGALMVPRIACGFLGCTRNATCRVWTKTGWLNLCVGDRADPSAPNHYARHFRPENINVCRPQNESHTCQEIRERFQRSFSYQRMQGVVTPAVRSLIGREPGSDDEPIDQKPISTNAENGQAISHVTQSSSPALGIPWDPIEVEMQNGGKP